MRRSRIAVSAMVVGTGIAAAVFLAPAVLLPDASAPSRSSAYVDAARADLASNLNDHELLPIRLRFLRADCPLEGGAAFLFEQRTFPYVVVRYAYTLSSRWPPEAWSGGGNLSEPVDPDLAKFLGGHEALCT